MITVYSYEIRLRKNKQPKVSSWKWEVDESHIYVGEIDSYFEQVTFEDMIIYAESLVSAEVAKRLVVDKLFELAGIFESAKGAFDDDN